MFYLIHRDQTNIKNYVLVYWSGQINGKFVYTEYAGVISWNQNTLQMLKGAI